MNTPDTVMTGMTLDRSTDYSTDQAKLELVRSILNKRQNNKEIVKGKDFDNLMDMELDELYVEEIKETDRIYNKTNRC
jgi:hypothetical protein